jgi:hypothetical protein
MKALKAIPRTKQKKRNFQEREVFSQGECTKRESDSLNSFNTKYHYSHSAFSSGGSFLVSVREQRLLQPESMVSIPEHGLSNLSKH